MENINIYSNIVNALGALGASCLRGPDNSPYKVNGILVNVCVRTKLCYSWDRNGPSKSFINIACYGGSSEHRSFPMLKNGSFSFDKIAEALNAWTKAQVSVEAKHIATAQAIESNKEMAQGLLSSFGMNNYGKVRLSPSATGVVFETKAYLTQAQAEIMLEAAQKCGLL